jgi:hypothetical protein
MKQLPLNEQNPLYFYGMENGKAKIREKTCDEIQKLSPEERARGIAMTSERSKAFAEIRRKVEREVAGLAPEAPEAIAKRQQRKESHAVTCICLTCKAENIPEEIARRTIVNNKGLEKVRLELAAASSEWRTVKNQGTVILTTLILSLVGLLVMEVWLQSGAA